MEITETIGDKEVIIKIKNLRNGMASTIGNFLRRTYLIEDSATQVIAVKMNEGEVKTQFQSISGVVEDAMAIISNLQLVEFSKSELGVPKVVGLSSKETSEIRAKDLTVTPFTVNNPDNIILRKRPESQFTMEVYLLNDKGYKTKEQNELLLRESGVNLEGLIILDSNHKSIDKAWFDVKEETSLTEELIYRVTSSKGGLEELDRDVKSIIKILQHTS